jgi:heat shock protein HslJ
MKSLKIMFVLLIFALTLGACSGSAAQPSLNATSWTLTKLQGKPILPNSAPTLAFADGQASGNGSCNSFGSSYKVRNDTLTFGPMMSTLMACMDTGVMEQESAYLAALASVAKYSLENDRLILYDSGGQAVAEFVKAQ